MSLNDQIRDVAIEGLCLAARSHMWHLTTKSYAQHMALGELYTKLHDIVDSLVEPALGSDFNLDLEGEKWEIPFDLFEVGGIDILEEFCATLQALIDALKSKPEYNWLSNLVQSAQDEIYGILYKLKRLS